MKIVCNASPLINLARIGKLGLLRELYEELIIPEAVWQEVVVEGAGQPGAEEVKAADWIKTQSVTNKDLKRALRQEWDLRGDIMAGEIGKHFLNISLVFLGGVFVMRDVAGVLSDLKTIPSGTGSVTWVNFPKTGWNCILSY